MGAPRRQALEDSADALDAVICVFAGIAVTSGQALQPLKVPALAEGRIAVHKIPGTGRKALGFSKTE